MALEARDLQLREYCTNLEIQKSIINQEESEAKSRQTELDALREHLRARESMITQRETELSSKVLQPSIDGKAVKESEQKIRELVEKLQQSENKAKGLQARMDQLEKDRDNHRANPSSGVRDTGRQIAAREKRKRGKVGQENELLKRKVTALEGVIAQASSTQDQSMHERQREDEDVSDSRKRKAPIPQKNLEHIEVHTRLLRITSNNQKEITCSDDYPSLYIDPAHCKESEEAANQTWLQQSLFPRTCNSKSLQPGSYLKTSTKDKSPLFLIPKGISTAEEVLIEDAIQMEAKRYREKIEMEEIDIEMMEAEDEL